MSALVHEPIEMASPMANSINGPRQSSRQGLRSFCGDLISSTYHSFDRHPQSFNPDAELTLSLEKTLKDYHSQLIALGSAIGTGLFIGSGAGLATAGPIPLLGAFCFVGLTLCPTVFALGEMATFLPYPGAFGRPPIHIIGPSINFESQSHIRLCLLTKLGVLQWVGSRFLLIDIMLGYLIDFFFLVTQLDGSSHCLWN
jgi:amino acid permease